MKHCLKSKIKYPQENDNLASQLVEKQRFFVVVGGGVIRHYVDINSLHYVHIYTYNNMRR